MMMMILMMMGSQFNVAVIPRASHLCGPGIESWAPHVGWDLSISIWLRGFFSGYSGFPPSLTLCSEVTHGPYSGCQEALIYAFGPTLSSCAASVLWGGDECESFFLSFWEKGSEICICCWRLASTSCTKWVHYRAVRRLIRRLEIHLYFLDIAYLCTGISKTVIFHFHFSPQWRSKE